MRKETNEYNDMRHEEGHKHKKEKDTKGGL